MAIIHDFLRGAVIGIANIIPGVSGGTMALVLGIYERLIAALHNISLHTIRAAVGICYPTKEHIASFREEMKRIDAVFLLILGTGAIAAIVALAKVMTFLLKQHHDPTYGFFFGLVLLSAIAPYKLIKKKTISVFLVMIIAMASVFTISFAVSGDTMLHKAQKKHELRIHSSQNPVTAQSHPSRTSSISHYAYMFLLGAISISAMILPGVSGSFLLLLLGGYFDILGAIAARDLPVLGAFALGCIVGLLLFTRFLAFLLSRWHDHTMGFLLGLVAGSLWMIWPFKTTASVGSETIYLSNMFPSQCTGNEILTIAAFITGSLIVALMLYIEYRRGTEQG